MSGTGVSSPGALWRVTGAQRILAFGSLLGAIAFFAAMPFGALYLDQYTALPTVAVGAVIGGISLIGAVGGFAGGMVVDRIGAVRSMQAGLAGDVVIYGLLCVVRGTVGIVALFLLLGVARVLIEPASKKLMSDSSDDDGRVFRLRYMTLCTGAIIGPLAGGLLYTLSITAFFAVPAALCAWFLVVVARNAAVLQGPRTAGGATSGYPVRLALRDRRLLAAIAAGLIVFLVFSQLETMVPLVMRDHFGGRTEALFSWLLIANAVLALALQPVIDKLTPRLGHNVVVVAGAVGFAAAFGCFAAMGTGIAWLYLGIVFWTVGEGALLPMPDMAVHQLAADDRKGTYFGLAELRYVGFFAGPVAGGWLLGSASSTVPYFLVSALAISVGVPFLLRRKATAGVAIEESGAQHVEALVKAGAAHAA